MCSETGIGSDKPAHFMPFPPPPSFFRFGPPPPSMLPPFGAPPPHLLPRRPPSEFGRDTLPFDRYSDQHRGQSPYLRERSPPRRDKPSSRRRSPTSVTNDSGSLHSSSSAARLSPSSDVPGRAPAEAYAREGSFNPRMSSTFDGLPENGRLRSPPPTIRDPPRVGDYQYGNEFSSFFPFLEPYLCCAI